VTSFLRTLLILLLAIPSAAVPQGMSLDWCLCIEAQSACCGVTCCEPETHAEVSSCAHQGTPDCAGCHTIEVDPFELGLESEGFVLPPIVPTFIGTVIEHAPVQITPTSLFGSGRAPPGVVRPTGLLPGVLPLRR
jgi:hypothetical protein